MHRPLKIKFGNLVLGPVHKNRNDDYMFEKQKKQFNPMSESFSNLLGLTSSPAKSFNFRLGIWVAICIYSLTDILIFSNQLVQECVYQHRGSVLLGRGLYLLFGSLQTTLEKQ